MTTKDLPNRSSDISSPGWFEAIFAHVAVGISVVDLQGRIQKVNQAYCQMLGYSEDELLNLSFADITHPDDIEEDLNLAARLFEGEISTYQLEKRYIHKNGSLVWVHLSCSCLKDSSGKVLQGLGVTQDITERKLIENNLKISEARFRRAIDASVVGIVTGSLLTGQITSVNDAFLKMIDYTRDDILSGRIGWQDITPAEYHYLDEQAIQDLLKKGNTPPFEKQYVTKGGRRIDVLVAGTLLDDTHDIVIVFVVDITQRKQTEKAWNESQERYKLVVEATNDGICDWNITNDQVYWNDRYYEILGLNRKDIPEPSQEFARSLIHPQDHSLVQAFMHDHLQEKKSYPIEIRMRHSTGDYRYVRINARAVWNEQGIPVRLTGTITDITESKQAEIVLKESEERFRTMADAAPVLIWTCDSSGAGDYFNKTWLTFTGRTLEQELGFGWTVGIHPDDRERCIATCEEAKLNRSVLNMEFRLRRFDGEYRWILDTANPRFTADGELVGYIGSMVDITDIKEAEQELKDYAHRLENSNKELEQFATVVSHDLQEPLRKVMIFSQYLRQADNCHFTDEAHDYISRMQCATERMQSLITDLLDLSRINRKGQPFQKTKLNEVLSEVLSDLHFTIKDSQGKIEVGELPEIEADAQQMGQLFQNLISNALKFHRDSVSPVVTISARTINNTFCEIRIKDNGIGFEEKYLDRIFGIFERLHGRREYPGTGIGLAICHRIIQRHGGSITATSIPDQGSTFIVILPLRQ